MASSLDPPHIVVLPFPLQGHINPLMQLAQKLANHGAVVTFVMSENMVPAGSNASTIPNLSFVGVSDNLPPERSRRSSVQDSVESMVNMEAGFRDLVHRLHHLRHRPISAIIYDAFMTWAQDITSELSIPCISFFTSNATCCALVYQVPALLQRGVLPFRRDGDEEGPLPRYTLDDIEGVPEVLPEEFPLCLTFNASDFRYKLLTAIGQTMQKASAIIVNAMEELEPAAVAAMRAQKPFYPVGPLLLLSGGPSGVDVNYWAEQDHCLPWLDAQPPDSVLYVSFGSVACLPTSHFQELALGLEASGQRFLWVVRPDSIEPEEPLERVLPDGFLSRTKDRGLIISWSPQLLILSHPSIGGFFTHGGWNSIIENMSMASVPMICWPHIAEQRLNRKLMADHWHIGMKLQHESDGGVAKEEVARVVRDLMQGKLSVDLRNSARKVGEMAKRAVAHDGSSLKNFEALYKLLTLPKEHEN